MKQILRDMIIDNPVVVFEDEKISEVLHCKVGEYNHVPVVDRNGVYKGIVSKIDIFPLLISGIEDKLVSEILVPFKPINIRDWSASLLEKLLSILMVSKFLFIPTVDDEGKLFGIIPNKTVLELFSKSIGVDEDGQVLEVTGSDIAGTLNRMVEVFKDEGVSIIAINVVNLDFFNLRKVFIKFKGDKAVKEKMLAKLESLGYKSF